MAFSICSLKTLVVFISFHFMTVSETYAAVNIEDLKTAICAVTDGTYDTSRLLSQNVWSYNRTKDPSKCLKGQPNTNVSSCEFLFSFCHAYNCSDTDKSVMNTTACVTSQDKSGGSFTFKLGSYDPNVNPFENVKDGNGRKFLAHFTKGGSYNISANQSCFLSMDVEFDCNENLIWQTSVQKKGIISETALTSIDFNKTTCKYTLKFDYSGACPPNKPEEKEYLSFGSWLLILFFVGLTVYFVFGSIFNYCTGSRGKEIIPHNEFWTMLPVYIADGFIFTCTCGRGTGEANSKYDSI